MLGGESRLHYFVRDALRGGRSTASGRASRPAAAQVTRRWVERTASLVLGTVQSARATWQANHVRAEAERHARAAGVRYADLDRAVDRIVAEALSPARSILLDERDRITAAGGDPAKLRRSDGTSVFTVAGAARYTSAEIIAAEQAIVAAGGQRDGRTVDAPLCWTWRCWNRPPTASTSTPARSSWSANSPPPARGCSSRSPRPAPARPPRCGCCLRPPGPPPAAPSSGSPRPPAAAAVLREEIDTDTDTLAKLIWHITGGDGPPPAWIATIGPDTLVVIDEAGMAGTPDLATAIEYITDRGGSVRLIGDDQQLAAIGAGGVLRDIADTHGAVTLSQVMRFTDPPTPGPPTTPKGPPRSPCATATRPRSPTTSTTAASTSATSPPSPTDAYTAWSADRAAGRDAIMLAPTRDLVAELNDRARTDRLLAVDQSTGQPMGREVVLADSSRASAGDTIITRKNNRTQPISATDWVKNGDRWRVDAVHDNGALDVTHLATNRHVTLPARYVREHVHLGYASTVHGAQGITADTCYTVATGEESRQLLYVAMTRGRHANHVYLTTAGDGDPHSVITRDALLPPTAGDILARVLARDASPMSATSQRRELTRADVMLGATAARYHHALTVAAEDHLGADRLARIDAAAEATISGITRADAYPALRAHLALLALDGHDPTDRPDPGRRLQPRPGRRPRRRRRARLAPGPHRSPLRRHRSAPVARRHPRRAHRDRPRVGHLPSRSRRLRRRPARHRHRAGPRLDADQRTHMGHPPGRPRPRPGRRAGGLARHPRRRGHRPATHRPAAASRRRSPRPTGTRPARHPPARRPRTPQPPGGRRWPTASTPHHHRPLLATLADRLTAVERAGIDITALTRTVAAYGPLPDEQPAAALWWRLAGHLSPAAMTANRPLRVRHTAPGLDTGAGRHRRRRRPPTRAGRPRLALPGRRRHHCDNTSRPRGMGTRADPLDLLRPAPRRPTRRRTAAPRRTGHRPGLEDRHAHRPPPPPPCAPRTPASRCSVEPAAADLAHPTSLFAVDPTSDGRRQPHPSVSLPVTVTPSRTRWVPSYPAVAPPRSPRAPARTQRPGRRVLHRPLPRRVGTDLSDRTTRHRPRRRRTVQRRLRPRPVDRAHRSPAPRRHRRGDRRRRPGQYRLHRARHRPIPRPAGLPHQGRRRDPRLHRPPQPDEDRAGQRRTEVPQHRRDRPVRQGPRAVRPQRRRSGARRRSHPGTRRRTDGRHRRHPRRRGDYVGVAPLGTAFTDTQADRLTRYLGADRPGLIVATDNDPAGQQAAHRAFWQLTARGGDPAHLHVPHGKDPAELLQADGAAALHAALTTPGSLADTLIQARINQFADRLDTVEGRVLATRRAAEVIGALPPPAWAGHLSNVVALTGIAVDTAVDEVLDAGHAWTEQPQVLAKQRIAEPPQAPPKTPTGPVPPRRSPRH